MSRLDVVRRFINDYGPRYEALLGTVKAGCLKAKSEFGTSVILRVYSRSDKQGISELKETTKIAEAVGDAPTVAALQDLSDIIGVTIVVQYPDQIQKVLDRVAEILKPGKIVEAAKRKELRETYFATHAVFISHQLRDQGLKCEVQCKTLLHDAWSAKMHDLTYKPQGSIDLRLRGLVEAISATLEGLEQQSEIVRDMITARQMIERRPFQTSLEALHMGLVDTFMGEWTRTGALEGLEELCGEIEAAGVQLGIADQEEPDLSALAMQITTATAERKRMRVCWILAVRLVGFRIDPDGLLFLSNVAERVMDALPGLLRDGMLTERELRSVPLGFYVVQSFDLAIDFVDRLLEKADAFALTNECRMLLMFNKATWLVERESMRRAKPAVAAAAQREAIRLLAEFQAGYDTSKFVELVDTEGLMKIVFGTTKEEVRKGIHLCNKGAALTTDEEESPVAAAYAEWRAHIGWRRYFELAENAP
jgi:ppGpp synthetase/RelA/SpoT-type nucleotidyltranferase